MNSFLSSFLKNNFKILLCAIIVIIFSSISFAQKDIEKLVLTGLEHCYNFRWDKAEKTFLTIIENHPDSPQGYHYLSSVYFWYFLSSKSEIDLKTFRKYSDETLDKADKLLSDDNENAQLLYLIGSNYNYRTIAFTTAGDYLSAVWAAKKSESYLSDCIETDSTFYDAYLGLGLYNFAVANIPSGFKWALNLAGISGEERKGLQFIKITAEHGRFAKTEAQYYLSQIASEALLDYELAESYLKNLTKKYPENLLFSYSKAVVNIKQRNLDEAEKILLKLIDNEEDKFLQLISFSNFLLGDIYFRKNEFETAQKYYLEFLSSAVDNDYTGIASYRLAISFEASGNRDSAKTHFELASNGNKDLEDDVFAFRKSTIYANRTMDRNEIELIKHSNLIHAGKFDAALDSLARLLSNLKTEKLKAEIYFYLSEAAYCLDRFDESIDYALNAVKLSSAGEDWIDPFSYYNAARASAVIEKLSDAKKYLVSAGEFEGFDYQKKLEHMIEALEKKMLIF